MHLWLEHKKRGVFQPPICVLFAYFRIVERILPTRLPPYGRIRFLVGTLLAIFSEHMHTHLLANPFFDRF